MANSGWQCLEEVGDEFLVVSSPGLDFIQAALACAEEDATLARIESVQEFFGIIRIGSCLVFENAAWIGVRCHGSRHLQCTALFSLRRHVPNSANQNAKVVRSY